MNHDTLRILDASLNRASEGLRVVEDYARFVLDDAHLTDSTKRLRHALAAAAASLDSHDLHACRETQADVGVPITTASESQRSDPWDVCTASLKRVEQSLRSLEEYGKLVDSLFASQCEQTRYQLYTLEKAMDSTRVNRQRLEETKLYVLIDGGESRADFKQRVKALAEAGVHVLQLRDKELPDRVLVERARQLVELTRGKCLAIINDRPDIAAATHADGVHLGQEEMSVKDARSIVGPRALIGVSTHAIGQARQAVLDGANYLGAGPIFPSTTKSFDNFPGLGYLREVSADVTLPTFAIGGINETNLPQVFEAGATRIAVSGAITNAADPAKAANKLTRALESD